MKVLLTGGGTGGSVTPLIAVAQEIRKQIPKTQFLFIGTKRGPEEMLARAERLPFQAITAGKLRRYFSWRNLIDPLLVIAGFFQAWTKLSQYHPDVIFGAGAYVSVPVIWAARLLHIPTLIHQQDVVKSLANRLVERVATRITVTFERSLKDFPPKKTLWVGNPIRPEIIQGDRQRAQNIFGLEPDLPTVLVFGGGTGALKINELMVGAIFKLAQFCQIIHIFGPDKILYKAKNDRYHGYEFLGEEMKEAYAAADVIVCRAGLASLTEIAALGKAAIIIPLPETHQEMNAELFKRANAAVVLDQRILDPDFLVNVISGLLSNQTWRATLQKNIKSFARLDARSRLAAEVLSLVISHGH